MEKEGEARVELRVAASRSYLPNKTAALPLSDSCLPVYLAVEIDPPKEPIPADLNLVLLIDRSGSMFNTDRLTNVLKALHKTIDLLNVEDHCTIIAFADRSMVVAQANGQDALLHSALDSVLELDPFELGGSSNIFEGIKGSYQALESLISPGKVNRVLLFTDGRATMSDWTSLWQDRYGDGISITTLGLGDDFDEGLLTTIAEKSGGNYYYIGNSSYIPDILERELKWIRAVAIKHTELKLDLLSGVEIIDAFRYRPELYSCSVTADAIAQPSAQSVNRCWVGEVATAVRVGYLFHLLVPFQTQMSDKLVKVELLGTLDNGATRKVLARGELEIGFTHEPTLIGRIESNVMELAERACLVKLREQADLAAIFGDIKRALFLFSAMRMLVEKFGQERLRELLERLLEQLSTHGRMDNPSAKSTGSLIRGLFRSSLDRLNY